MIKILFSLLLMNTILTSYVEQATSAFTITGRLSLRHCSNTTELDTLKVPEFILLLSLVTHSDCDLDKTCRVFTVFLQP